MDSINSNMGMGPEIYAMKKAVETQGQGIMKLLESVATPPVPAQSSSGADVTGIGQNLDIRA